MSNFKRKLHEKCIPLDSMFWFTAFTQSVMLFGVVLN